MPSPGAPGRALLGPNAPVRARPSGSPAYLEARRRRSAYPELMGERLIGPDPEPVDGNGKGPVEPAPAEAPKGGRGGYRLPAILRPEPGRTPLGVALAELAPGRWRASVDVRGVSLDAAADSREGALSRLVARLARELQREG
jgi:hypothetical protein